MATWETTTGAWDKVRSPQPDGGKILFDNVEIDYSGGVRVFTETDLDNGTTAAVINTTGTTPTVGKGSDGDPVFGFIESISEDGCTASILVAGVSKEIAYSTTSTEDPDVTDRVTSNGDGKVRQSAGGSSITAGGKEVGRGYVITKNTTDVTVRILL